MTKQTKTRLLCGVEITAMLVLAAYASICGAMGTYVYRADPWIGNNVTMAALLYILAIGSGSKWGCILPALFTALSVYLAFALRVEEGDIIESGVIFTLVPALLALALYFCKKQAWLLPLAACCAAYALVAQVVYLCTQDCPPYLLDTFGLLAMCAETGFRSYSALNKGRYFYTAYIIKD